MRILVTAASKHGATAEIANAIAAVLRGSGCETDVLEPGAVRSVDGYDAVIVGSGVYAGRWIDSAKQLVTRLEADLRARPTWVFSSGPLGTPPKPEEVPPDGAAISAKIGAREHRVFAGRMDRSHLSFVEKAVVGAVKAPDGDFRPWEEIRAWATGIARELAGERPAVVTAAS